MLRSVKQLTGLQVQAADGDIGTIRDLYFDDERWTVRYLVVDTGGWLRGRKVLISPYAVTGFDIDANVVGVNLTRKQVEDSPDIDTDKPVSRQQEGDYHRYYGYPTYWPYTSAWAYGAMPAVTPPDPTAGEQRMPASREQEEVNAESGDIHLRSCNEVIGYRINAMDDAIGHVENLLLEPHTWAIRYLVVDTRKWLAGKHVLVPPHQVSAVSWPQREVAVELSKQQIESSPEYDPEHPVPGVYEISVSRDPRQAPHAH